VAQLASALAWGARGRPFESDHPDKERGSIECSFFTGSWLTHHAGREGRPFESDHPDKERRQYKHYFDRLPSQNYLTLMCHDMTIT